MAGYVADPEASLQLERLSTLALRSEDDVREEFVTPLLRLLGYEHARGEVRRGVPLRIPYQTGTARRTNIVPDYLAGVGQMCFLALDAKAPGESDSHARAIVTSEEHVSQVHSYAAHRDVQAVRFVVSNGQYTAVYDTSVTTFNPVCVISQAELRQRFGELETLISKRSLATIRAASLPLAWSMSLHRAEVGFQPLNIDIGDVDHDGLDEIVLGLSEDHIPAYDQRGAKVFDHATDGWVWWVKCTHTRQPRAATVVALQLPSQQGHPGGILGLNRDGIIWRHTLERMGSGFETLDRILVLDGPESVVVGIPVDDIVLRLTLTGEVLWETRLGVASPFGATMHVMANGPRSPFLLATVNRQHDGILATLDSPSGRILRTLELPFRGAQILLLPTTPTRCLVTDADAPQIALASLVAPDPPLVFKHGCSVGNVPIVIDDDSQLVFVGGVNALVAYSLPELLAGRLSVVWETNRIPGLVHRLRLDRGRKGPVLLVGTCGSAAAPNPNGVYLVTLDGAIVERVTLVSTPERALIGPPGVRDARVLTARPPAPSQVIAVSDDWRLYAWSL